MFAVWIKLVGLYIYTLNVNKYSFICCMNKTHVLIVKFGALNSVHTRAHFTHA